MQQKILDKVKNNHHEFLDFLKNYKVIELAIGVVIGNAVKDLVTAIAQDLIMPIVGIFTPTGSWRELVFIVAGSEFKIGNIISALLDFAIVAFIVFIVVKKLLKINDKI
ncbi:MAG: MscL family protein [Candidatus Shapirobacteria bacterium]